MRNWVESNSGEILAIGETSVSKKTWNSIIMNRKSERECDNSQGPKVPRIQQSNDLRI